ncbi:hypothetical protein DF032_33985 [Burkholderia seminalis]|nr:hypothetical protein DF032_33985 [Burkholderia seminalis]
MLRTSRTSIKRIACQRPRPDRTTPHGGAPTPGMREAAAYGCPRTGRAAHHAHANAHRRSACNAIAHGAIHGGTGIAESAHRHSMSRPS